MTWSASTLWAALTVVPLGFALPNAINEAVPSSSDHGYLGARDSSDAYPWAALGDSFAAGPGAGEAYDQVQDQCFRNKGAYPPQLSGDFPFPENDLQFLACTADTVDDMIDSRLQSMNDDQQVVTLSIGGNDIKFAKIVRACIFKPAGPASDDCQEVIDEAQAIIDNKLEDIL
jgi:lysophospholipase L1-like esterase